MHRISGSQQQEMKKEMTETLNEMKKNIHENRKEVKKVRIHLVGVCLTLILYLHGNKTMKSENFIGYFII